MAPQRRGRFVEGALLSLIEDRDPRFGNQHRNACGSFARQAAFDRVVDHRRVASPGVVIGYRLARSSPNNSEASAAAGVHPVDIAPQCVESPRCGKCTGRVSKLPGRKMSREARVTWQSALTTSGSESCGKLRNLRATRKPCRQSGARTTTECKRTFS